MLLQLLVLYAVVIVRSASKCWNFGNYLLQSWCWLGLPVLWALDLIAKTISIVSVSHFVEVHLQPFHSHSHFQSRSGDKLFRNKKKRNKAPFLYGWISPFLSLSVCLLTYNVYFGCRVGECVIAYSVVRVDKHLKCGIIVFSALPSIIYSLILAAFRYHNSHLLL